MTVVDTAGASLSREAEEGGLAGEIARCLTDLVTLPAPTLCLLLGEGAGGGALAFLPTDRVVAAQHAWLSPLPPEGASAVLYRTTERAVGRRTAGGRRGGPPVPPHRRPGHPRASPTPPTRVRPSRRVGTVLEAELGALLRSEPSARYGERRHRYRTLGLV